MTNKFVINGPGDSGVIELTPEEQTAWDAEQPTPAENLAAAVKEAKYDIDYAAEMARLRYITNGAGQSMIYQEKGIEAASYIAAGYPVDLTGYPFIQAEVNATGQTTTEAADNIIALRTSWIALGASIEEARLGGKKNVDDAADVGAVYAARDATVTALDGI